MPQLHIRRATVDDLPALQSLWLAAQLPADELENRLTVRILAGEKAYPHPPQHGDQ